jgi:hypothetical protein
MMEEALARTPAISLAKMKFKFVEELVPGEAAGHRCVLGSPGDQGSCHKSTVLRFRLAPCPDPLFFFFLI